MTERLHLVSPQDARQVFFRNIPPPKPMMETIKTMAALGRVTAHSINAPEPSPAFSKSTMDGYAVFSKDVEGASNDSPVKLAVIEEVPMGKAPEFSVGAHQAAVIHTGGMLPEGADGVVMVEDTQIDSTGHVWVQNPVKMGENVVLKGEDIRLGQEILPAGKMLRPADIGGLLSLGLTQVEVNRRPKVGIISSGDEVIPPDRQPQIGQVRDVNSFDLAALVTRQGGQPVINGITSDKPDRLKETILASLAENDMVIITAGSSASERDLTAKTIQDIGNPGVLVHGINIRPGKPTILAVCDGKPVIGLPGNPLSALVIATLFVPPVINYLAGLPPFPPQATLTAHLTQPVSSLFGKEEWLPVKLQAIPGGYEADPIEFKSSFIFNLVFADGMFCIPADQQGLEAGSMVNIILF